MKNILKSIVLVAFGIGLACGGGSSSSDNATITNANGVTLTGTVSIPMSTSISNASLSKEAIQDVSVRNGTMTAMTMTGIALGTASIANGAFSIIVDPNALDATTQVVLVATIGEEISVNSPKLSNIIDVTGKTAGQSVDAGPTNGVTTLGTQQVYYYVGADCTPEAVSSACASAIVSNTISPPAMFLAFMGMIDGNVSGVTTPGFTSAGGSYQSLALAYESALAVSSSNPTALIPTFADINLALAGNATILDSWKGMNSTLSAINMSSAILDVQGVISALPKIVNDATTNSKLLEAGDSGAGALAKFFAGLVPTDLTNISSKPEIYQQYFQQKMTTFVAGDTSALDSLKDSNAASVLAKLSGGCSASDLTGKYDELEKIMDAQKAKFATLSDDAEPQFASSLCNQMKAADSVAELNLLSTDPGTFANKMFDKPGIYDGAGGVTKMDNQFIAYKQNEQTFKGGTGCSSDADCGGTTPLCSSDFYFCVQPCNLNCGVGFKCTMNSQCASGICSSLGSCIVGTGNDPLAGALLQNGSSCTANSQCLSGTCSGATCAAPVAPGSVSYAGFYKKNAEATCVTAINIDGTSASDTKISFVPNDPINPGNNTFFGGNINFSGSGPFTISEGAIMATTAPAGAQGTLKCDGTGGSTTLSLVNGRLTGTCVLTATQGTFNVANCIIDHTKQ